MGLIIKRSTKAFWNAKDKWQKPIISFFLEQFLSDTSYRTILCSMLDFPENEEDSRNLKNVQELIQHFSEKFRYYVPNQNVTFKNEEQNF